MHRIFIETTPERISQAITDPAWNGRYGYGGRAAYDRSPGGSYRSFASEAMEQASTEMGFPQPPEVVVDEVVLADPPSQLVQTWQMLVAPHHGGRGVQRRLTYDICRLTVTHELGGMPALDQVVRGSGELGAPGGGGWDRVLSDLKTLLETGSGFAG